MKYSYSMEKLKIFFSTAILLTFFINLQGQDMSKASQGHINSNKFNINSIECLKVSLEIENHQELLEKIVGLYDKNN